MITSIDKLWNTLLKAQEAWNKATCKDNRGYWRFDIKNYTIEIGNYTPFCMTVHYDNFSKTMGTIEYMRLQPKEHIQEVIDELNFKIEEQILLDI